MAALTVDVSGRVRNRRLATNLGWMAVQFRSDRLLRWAISLMRLDMKIGNGRWKTFARLRLEGGVDGGTLDWERI